MGKKVDVATRYPAPWRANRCPHKGWCVVDAAGHTVVACGQSEVVARHLADLHNAEHAGLPWSRVAACLCPNCGSRHVLSNGRVSASCGLQRLIKDDSYSDYGCFSEREVRAAIWELFGREPMEFDALDDTAG